MSTEIDGIWECPVWRHIGGESIPLDQIIKRFIFSLSADWCELDDKFDESDSTDKLEFLKEMVSRQRLNTIKLTALTRWIVENFSKINKISTVMFNLEQSWNVLQNSIFTMGRSFSEILSKTEQIWSKETAFNKLMKRKPNLDKFSLSPVKNNNFLDLICEEVLLLRKESSVSQKCHCLELKKDIFLLKMPGFNKIRFQPNKNDSINRKVLWILKDFDFAHKGLEKNNKDRLIRDINTNLNTEEKESKTLKRLLNSLTTFWERYALLTLKNQIKQFSDKYKIEVKYGFSLGRFLEIEFWNESKKFHHDSEPDLNPISPSFKLFTKNGELFVDVLKKNDLEKEYLVKDAKKSFKSLFELDLNNAGFLKSLYNLNFEEIMFKFIDFFVCVRVVEIFRMIHKYRKVVGAMGSIAFCGIILDTSEVNKIEKIHKTDKINKIEKTEKINDYQYNKKEFLRKFKNGEIFHEKFIKEDSVDCFIKENDCLERWTVKLFLNGGKPALKVSFNDTRSVVIISINRHNGFLEFDVLDEKINLIKGWKTVPCYEKTHFTNQFYMAESLITKNTIQNSILKTPFLQLCDSNLDSPNYLCDCKGCSFLASIKEIDFENLKNFENIITAQVRKEKNAYVSWHFHRNMISRVFLVVKAKELKERRFFSISNNLTVEQSNQLISSLLNNENILLKTEFIKRCLTERKLEFRFEKTSSEEYLFFLNKNAEIKIKWNKSKLTWELSLLINNGSPFNVYLFTLMDKKRVDKPKGISKNWVIKSISKDMIEVQYEGGIKSEFVKEVLFVIECVAFFGSFSMIKTNIGIEKEIVISVNGCKKVSVVKIQDILLNKIVISLVIKGINRFLIDINVKSNENGFKREILIFGPFVLSNRKFIEEIFICDKDIFNLVNNVSKSIIYEHEIERFLCWSKVWDNTREIANSITKDCPALNKFSILFKDGFKKVNVDIGTGEILLSDENSIVLRTKTKFQFDTSENMLNALKEWYFESGFEYLTKVFEIERKKEIVKNMSYPFGIKLVYKNEFFLLKRSRKENFKVNFDSTKNTKSGDAVLLERFLKEFIIVPPFCKESLRCFMKLLHSSFECFSCFLPLIELHLTKNKRFLLYFSLPNGSAFDVEGTKIFFIANINFNKKNIKFPFVFDILNGSLSLWTLQNDSKNKSQKNVFGMPDNTLGRKISETEHKTKFEDILVKKMKFLSERPERELEAFEKLVSRRVRISKRKF